MSSSTSSTSSEPSLKEEKPLPLPDKVYYECTSIELARARKILSSRKDEKEVVK